PPSASQLIAFGYAGKREPARERLGIHAQHARFLRAIQIETTGVLALPHAAGNEVNAGQVARSEAIKFLSRARVQIFRNRHGRKANEGKSTSAGILTGGIARAVEPEHTNCRDKEHATREQRNGSETAGRT